VATIKEDQTVEYEWTIAELKELVQSGDPEYIEKDFLIKQLQGIIQKYEHVNTVSVNYRNQLLETRHSIIQSDYTVENQKNQIDNLGKTLVRYEKENKALRELVSLWI